MDRSNVDADVLACFDDSDCLKNNESTTSAFVRSTISTVFSMICCVDDDAIL